jgi:predicted FMN-binding regulatory protein PaiB
MILATNAEGAQFLRGHVARGNSVWKSLTPEAPVLGSCPGS